MLVQLTGAPDWKAWIQGPSKNSGPSANGGGFGAFNKSDGSG